MAEGATELRLLGAVELVVDGTPISVPAGSQALLAPLALDAGRLVTADRLVDAL